VSEPWKPREHDHLVEPLFRGLDAGAPAEEPGDRGRRALFVGAAIVFVLLIVRIATLVF
jgi:hypothetical protein